MRKVFWDNPYQTKLITRVSSIVSNRILLAETIAFSFSGGQESDKAYINGFPVLIKKCIADFNGARFSFINSKVML